MKYLQQVYYEMKHQKMMTWVSISGTALAIFLVMAFFMTDQLATVEVAPETQRSAMLYGGGIEYHKGANWAASGSMSYKMIQRMYGDLEGIEMQSVSSSWDAMRNASVPNKVARSLDTKKTDGNFWKLYDFTFISGRPYEDADMENDAPKAVITQSVARNFFEKDDAAGEVLYLNTSPFNVVGVVKDVNPSLTATFANIYVPITQSDIQDQGEMGGLMVHLLKAPGVSDESVKAQVEQRYVRLNEESKKDSVEYVYHGAPHNAEYLATGEIFANVTPDLSGEKTKRYVIYFVLLLIPAINLSAMMRGRLRHRVSEIGVRRAFGAKRSSIVAQLLGENLIVTLIGGLIGLALSYLFMVAVSKYFIAFNDVDVSALQFAAESPSLSMLITWQGFAFVLAICFVLNLMSAFVPSWKASRVQPAEAISKSKI